MSKANQDLNQFTGQELELFHFVESVPLYSAPEDTTADINKGSLPARPLSPAKQITHCHPLSQPSKKPQNPLLTTLSPHNLQQKPPLRLGSYVALHCHPMAAHASPHGSNMSPHGNYLSSPGTR